MLRAASALLVLLSGVISHAELLVLLLRSVLATDVSSSDAGSSVALLRHLATAGVAWQRYCSCIVA